MVDAALCVNDTYFTQQWGLNNTGQSGGTSGVDIKACDAWQISTGNNVTVAILDHGIDLTHPDLAGNIHPLSYDSENRTSPSIIRGNHGTACAGIVGAVRNNNVGISGVAPNCRIMSISSSLDLNTLNIQQHLAAGVNWAWQNGADVISNSWGSNALQGSFITDAINNALTQGRNGRGCVVVFASGNNNVSTVNYPASLPNVIAVGAIDKCGIRSGRIDIVPNSCDPWCPSCDPGSAYGTSLDVVALGTNVSTTDRQGNAGYNYATSDHNNPAYSDYPNRDYTGKFGGTSAACPHVSGVAALILSVRPDLTQAQVRQAIESTCTKLPGYSFSNNSSHPNGTWNNQVGHGLLNAYAAVHSVIPTITGPSSICFHSAVTYTVANAPAGFTWSCSSNLTPGTASGNSRTFTGNTASGSYGWVAIKIPPLIRIRLPTG